MAGDHSMRLPADESAPRVAREAVDEWLAGAGPQVHGDARSVVTEMVTHAVRRGSPPIELSLARDGERVRVEVADAGGPGAPEAPEDWSRRVIEALAERWGVRGDDAHVWVELQAP
jgi:anti-sigma regulatory factor (Ser/Thr protein kinase)